MSRPAAVVRPERPGDFAAIRAVTAAAFAGAAHSAPPVDATGDPGEAALVEWLRADAGYLPTLALVAEEEGLVVGHAITTRGWIDAPGRDPVPALGLGPISVRPDRQGRGIGGALLAATVRGAEALGERLIALLGDPAYYGAHGWEPASRHGIAAPDPAWGELFQVRLLPAHDGARGTFRYAAPFARLG
ncbi:Acetyltransferase, GNAT family protein [Sinomonas atrocyanea]|uniref:Acetyltransferase, GNAT family protein n=1 Tax=Sinomonas atrocyanea TaxID=37927 RepID=A0A126ZYZ2_9MICC|nr:N-acetyltransferase [Sinomonas atrocyanea]AMM32408.1 Acetyltransferase, GNAT family protein [Sinomonas atrocyanea]GEB63935.1 N-acetyltransferase [Sinomonas atrocyanea]